MKLSTLGNIQIITLCVRRFSQHPSTLFRLSKIERIYCKYRTIWSLRGDTVGFFLSEILLLSLTISFALHLIHRNS